MANRFQYASNGQLLDRKSGNLVSSQEADKIIRSGQGTMADDDVVKNNFGVAISQEQKDPTRPEYPLYTSMLSPEGQLMEQYRLKAQPGVGFTSNLSDLDKSLSGIKLNTQGLEAIRKRSLSEGPSVWQNLMLQKQGIDEQTALQNAAAQSKSASSSAFSDLARRGGLSTGARERLARQSMRDLSSGQQQVRRSGMGQRLDIGTEDERQKLALLQQLPGMEVQSLQPEFTKTEMRTKLADAEATRKQGLDLANRDYSTGIDRANLVATMAEIGRKDNQNLAAYQEKMKAYAADQQAKATANSGGGKK